MLSIQQGALRTWQCWGPTGALASVQNSYRNSSYLLLPQFFIGRPMCGCPIVFLVLTKLSILISHDLILKLFSASTHITNPFSRKKQGALHLHFSGFQAIISNGTLNRSELEDLWWYYLSPDNRHNCVITWGFPKTTHWPYADTHLCFASMLHW